MKVSITDLEDGSKQIQVEVPPEAVQKEMEPFYRKYQRSIQLPGFRKGKVPLEILKKTHYGRLIKEEALETIVPKFYEEAIKGEKIKPISSANISHIEYEEGKPLRFTASVEVEPEVEIKNDYKGLEVVKPVYTVTDEDVEKRLTDLREENAVEKVVNRPAEEGDLLLVDFQRLDSSGVPIVGRKTENQVIKLTPETPPELFGVTTGEQRRVSFRYPADYPRADLAGTKEDYLVSVKEVRQRELPDLDDEFAKDVSDCSTLAELKEKIRAELTKAAEEQAMREVRRDITEQLLRKYSFDVPERMIENSLNALVERVKSISSKEVDAELIKKNNRGEAIRQIRTRLILDAIAKKEEIQVSDEEVDQKIAEIAESQKTDPKKLKEAMISQYRLESLREDLLQDKVMEFLIKHAKIKNSKVN